MDWQPNVIVLVGSLLLVALRLRYLLILVGIPTHIWGSFLASSWMAGPLALFYTTNFITGETALSWQAVLVFSGIVILVWIFSGSPALLLLPGGLKARRVFAQTAREHGWRYRPGPITKRFMSPTITGLFPYIANTIEVPGVGRLAQSMAFMVAADNELCSTVVTLAPASNLAPVGPVVIHKVAPAKQRQDRTPAEEQDLWKTRQQKHVQVGGMEFLVGGRKWLRKFLPETGQPAALGEDMLGFLQTQAPQVLQAVDHIFCYRGTVVFLKRERITQAAWLETAVQGLQTLPQWHPPLTA